MDPQLNIDQTNRASVLAETVTIAEKYFQQQHTLSPGRLIKNLSSASLSEKGIGASGALKIFANDIAPLLNNSAGPRYFGFVTGGSTPAAVAGDWLVSAFDQNAAGSNDSIAPQIEIQTLNFIKELVGLDQEYTGSFVTGATMSNMVGLALGRQWLGEQQGIDVSQEGLASLKGFRVFSGTPHSSILKACSMLGIGRKNIQLVPTLPDREAVDVNALERQLQETSAPCIVVANAGTVNTVDFDDLEAIARLREKYSFWLHVDAAFGGFAGASEKHKHLIEGINSADSITIDAHKWLNVPYDAAMQFTRHRQLQLKVFQNAAAYLSDPDQSPDFFHYTPENSRRFRALPSWFTLMAYGRSGHAEIVERNCRLANRLGEWVDQSASFRLLAPVRMNVVCFALAGENITTERTHSFLARVRDDGRTFFTFTMYKGTPAIRAAISNWMTTDADIDITIQTLKEINS